MLSKTCCRHAHGAGRWVEQQAHDPFINAAREKGYVARSAFKLLFIDDKYKLFQRHQTRTVIDLGCSPGGWCQVIREKCGAQCRVLAVDLIDLKATMTHATFIKGDFTSNEVQQTLLMHLRNQNYNWEEQYSKKNGNNHYKTSNIANEYECDNASTHALMYDKVDVITSDMCPNRMGGTADRYRIAHLQLQALNFSIPLMREGGHFVCKVLGSQNTFDEMYKLANKHFMKVEICKPIASRIHSDENFLVAYSKLAEPRTRMHHALYGSSKYGLDDWPGFCRRTGNGQSNKNSYRRR